MENILDLYAKEYDADYPVICFDERPCQLIDNIVTPIFPAEGKPAKQDYHYKRNGTCVVLMAIEPLTGNRVVEVCPTKTKKDYARFMQKVSNNWKQAKKIMLVQDNLNTHNSSSFYENLMPEDAFKLMGHFEMVYTPKKASWLNMAEIEFSALSKQCLDRRISDLETLRAEVTTWMNSRIQKKVTINWQFNISNAREKLQRHYEGIRNK